MSTVNDCLIDILSRMEKSKLKLNFQNPNLIIIGTKQQRNKIVDYFPIKILGNDTSPLDTVRNLGVVFDSNFSFHHYISQVCKSCFFHFQQFPMFGSFFQLSVSYAAHRRCCASCRLT